MIINIYQNIETTEISTKVDESTSHLLGDTLNLGEEEFVIISTEKREYFDYSTIIYVHQVKLQQRLAEDGVV